MPKEECFGPISIIWNFGFYGVPRKILKHLHTHVFASIVPSIAIRVNALTHKLFATLYYTTVPHHQNFWQPSFASYTFFYWALLLNCLACCLYNYKVFFRFRHDRNKLCPLFRSSSIPTADTVRWERSIESTICKFYALINKSRSFDMFFSLLLLNFAVLVFRHRCHSFDMFSRAKAH